MSGKDREKLFAFFALLLALFVASISATIVSTALPRMVGDLNGTQSATMWVISATLLATTVTIPIWGKLADLFDKKKVIQVAAVIFIVGATAAGFSQTMEQLIAARFLQGIGVGGLQSLVMICTAALISPRERGKYAGYQASATAVATIGGPLLGGLIVDAGWLGWRWCFYLMLPIAVISMVMIAKLLNLPVMRSGKVKIDYPGAGLLTVGVTALLIWVSFAGDSFDWVSKESAALCGAGVLFVAIAIWVETRVEEPLIPLKVLAQRTVVLAIIGSLASGIAMFGATVFMSQYFQLGRGNSPTEAGLMMSPMMGAIFVVSIIGGRMLSRSGAIRPFLLVGTISLTLGMAGLSQVAHDTPIVLVFLPMVLVGSGVALTAQNFILVVQNSVAMRDMGASTSTVTFFRSLGGTAGITILGAVLARGVTGIPAGTLESQIAFSDSVGNVFAIAGAMAAVGLAVAIALKPAYLRSTLDLEVRQPAGTSKA